MRTAGHRPDAHPSRIDAGARPSQDARHRLKTMLGDGIDSGQDHGGAAVGHARRAAGGDDAGRAVVLEDRRQFRQTRQRRLRPRMFVGARDGLPFRALNGHRRELGVECARGDCARRLLLAVEREGIAGLAGDVVFPRQNLGGLPHHEPAQRAGEPVAVHRVHEREVPHLVAPSRVDGIDEVRHAAHRLDAAGEHDVGFAERNRARAGSDSFHARRARLVHRRRRHAVRQPGAPEHLPRGVRSRASLSRMADEHVVHGVARERRALDRGARRNRAQLRRMHVAESAAVSADWCPGGADDEDRGWQHLTIVCREPRFRRVSRCQGVSQKTPGFWDFWDSELTRDWDHAAITPRAGTADYTDDADGSRASQCGAERRPPSWQTFRPPRLRLAAESLKSQNPGVFEDSEVSVTP